MSGKSYRVDYVPGFNGKPIAAIRRDMVGLPVGCNGWNHPEGIMHGAAACPVHDGPVTA